MHIYINSLSAIISWSSSLIDFKILDKNMADSHSLTDGKRETEMLNFPKEERSDEVAQFD